MINILNHARIEGNTLSFLEQIKLFYHKIDENMPSHLEYLLEKVRYSGYTPPQNEMENFQRQVERYFNNFKKTSLEKESIKNIRMYKEKN